MLDPQARAFLDYVATLKRPPVETLPLAEMRAMFEESFTRLGGEPARIGAVTDIAASGPFGPIPVRVYAPAGATAPLPMLVWYHGGGWVCGSPNSYDAVCRLLARESGCIVASVDYRLAPEHPAPEQLGDAYAALQWLAAHAHELGADATRLAVGGDSAGGGLAASIALEARDENGPALAHQLLVYPAVGDDDDTESMRAYGEDHFLTADRIAYYWKCHMPDAAMAKLPYVVALRAQTLHGLPPATIVMAECDPIYDQGIAYAQRLREDGVPVDLRVYDGMIHAFFSFMSVFDQGRAAVTDAGRAVGAALHAGAAV